MTLTQINKAGLDEIALDHVFTIGASGVSAYTFQGEGLNGTVSNPTLYLTRGKTYRFENGTGAHAIRIQSADNGTNGTLYNTGVTNNNTTGTVIVEVQHDAPDVLYYQCANHANMKGILYIVGALADGGVTTAKIADGAVTGAKLANGTLPSGVKVNHNNLQTGIIEDENISSSAAIAGSKISTAFTSNVAINTGNSTNDLSASNIFRIMGNDVRITNSAGSEGMLFASADGAVSLFHGMGSGTGAQVKLATTSTGVSVAGNATISGEITASDLAVDGTTLTVDATNNRVGIGTASPSKTFTVQGDILKTRSDSGLGLIYLQNDGSQNGQIQINQNSGVTRVQLNSEGDSYFNGGNLGVGTTSPSTKFHLKNTGSHTTWRIENDNADFLIQAGDAGADGLHFYDLDNSAYRMTIANSGNVGIGTTSPVANLHSYHATNNEAARFESGDEYVHILLKDSTTTTPPYMGAQGNNLRFITGGAEQLRINNDGHVTMANQPCAVVTNPASAGTSFNNSQNGVARTFQSTHISQGGMSITNTRSRITVPTTGTYLINLMLSGGVGTEEAGDGIIMRLRRNGANYPTDDAQGVESFGSENGMEWTFTWNLPVNLSANDYLEVVLDNIGGTVNFTIDRGYFAVNLLH